MSENRMLRRKLRPKKKKQESGANYTTRKLITIILQDMLLI
jgi:hypothetical protein